MDKEQIWIQEAAAVASTHLREIIHREHQTGLLEAAIISGGTGRAPFWDNIDDSYKRIGKLVAPWYSWDEKPNVELIGDETEQWESVFGKVSSEEVQAEVERMKKFVPKPNKTDGPTQYI